MKGRIRSAWFGACVGLMVALGLGLVVFHRPVAADGPPSFCNTASIAIPASESEPRRANPYPSNVTVSGLSGLVNTVTVTLNNLSHTFPSNIDILLVGPEGQNLILMGDTGSSFDISNVTLTFDDAAAASLPFNSQIVTGTFKPTATFPDNIFPNPAPTTSGATTLATFTGTGPNGTWSLYVQDDQLLINGDSGSLAGGWCVTITTAPDDDHDDPDECPNSDLSATVVIDGCDSGVPNTLFSSGCTISDFIAACADGASNHGQFVSCVSHMTNDLKKAGTITGQQKDAIQSCAAQADIP